MALSPTTELIRLPFNDRPAIGAPYPDGLAVGHIAVTGDATGGVVLALFESPGGFLYRLELLQTGRGDNGVGTQFMTDSHNWIEAAAGIGAGVFNFPHLLDRSGSILGTNVFTLNAVDLAMIRRFVMGDLRQRSNFTLFTITDTGNLDTRTYTFDVVFTYWRREALLAPGFLSSFYESPVVPAPIIIP